LKVEARAFQGNNDVADIVHVIATSFGAEGAEWNRKRLSKLKPVERKNLRCLAVNGRIVSFLEIVPKRMYVGRALLRMAGIAGVCTDPEFRNKGYNRRLFADALDFMAREGYEISILYGIPGYYHRYGYREVMARHLVTAPAPDGQMARPKWKSASVSKSDMKEICALYNAQARFRDGNCVRKSMVPPENGLKITDDKGRIAGYAAWREHDGAIEVREAAARDAAAGRELLTAIEHLAFARAADRLSVDLPPGYPLSEAMSGGRCVYRKAYRRNRGCMGRVISMAGLVKAMRPEWAHLVSRSEFARADFELRLKIGDDTLQISNAPSGLKATLGAAPAWSRTTPERFIQMVLGYRAAGALADESNVRFSKKDMRLIEVLFPERNAHILAPDRF